MYIIDDPTLALIARFVGDTGDSEFSDEEFFRQQLAAIEAYVDRFPEQQREQRAFEWIEANARQYRLQWQKRAAVGALSRARCPDCPLAGGDRQTPCAIHHQWLELLLAYAASELSSPEYVERSLALLGSYKKDLRATRARDSGAPPGAWPPFAGSLQPV